MNPPYESTNKANTTSKAPAFTGFIMELNPSASAGLGQLIYSSYFGGTGFSLDGDAGLGDAIGAMAEHSGVVYVTGLTTSGSTGSGGSTEFPSYRLRLPGEEANTGGISFEIGRHCQRNCSGHGVRVRAGHETNRAANQLEFSSLLGGTGQADVGLGLGIPPDLGNDIYVAGSTYSTDFPVTPNAYQFFNTQNNKKASGAS